MNIRVLEVLLELERRIMLKKLFFLNFFITINVFAETKDVIPLAPEGNISKILIILPLILMIFLLYRNYNMIITGFIGGTIAILISTIVLKKPMNLLYANKLLLKSIPDMLNFAAPIINSALAMAVFKSGGYTSALTLTKKVVKNKIEYLAVFVVLLQAAATYMSGIGGGSAMVIAPLAFAAVGVIPEVIAAMSIATAFAFTTSPASLETSIVSSLSNITSIEYSNSVKLITLIVVILSSALAYYGAKRSKEKIVNNQETKFDKMTNKELLRNTIPTLFLLFSVIFGSIINQLLPMPVFLPIVNIIVVIILIAIFTEMDINSASNSMIDGSSYILTRLLGVGIFITFIRIISETGAFIVIVDTVKLLPSSIILPSLILAGFLIGVPSGAYVGAILTLILPIAIKFNLSPLQLGFIAMGVGLGSQMCFVNITMQALSAGFQIPILSVVKGNTKWVLISVITLMLSSLLV